MCKEKDGQDASYLMVAMTALNENWEAHTNMAQYEHTLMEMWKEISRVYARNDIVLPLMGSGIQRSQCSYMMMGRRIYHYMNIRNYSVLRDVSDYLNGR